MKIEDMNVLSLFDGMSCGQIALNRAGFKIENYFACEIDKYAIQVTQANYPNTEQLGDVTKVSALDLPALDLVIGGSPCQGFSFAGKQLNFEDPRSKLFFEFVRLLKEARVKNPNVKFLLENVKMKKEYQDVITSYLGVGPIFIDSRHFTGHIRKRYYWTNLHVNEIKVKKSLKIEDIIDQDPFDKKLSFFLDRTPLSPTESYDGIITVNPKTTKGSQTWQRGRVYDVKGSCPTICASLFDLNITEDSILYRKLTVHECEKLQGVPRGYTDTVSKNQAGKLLGNGWTVDVITHILQSDISL